jgi:hypothetical protein
MCKKCSSIWTMCSREMKQPRVFLISTFQCPKPSASLLSVESTMRIVFIRCTSVSCSILVYWMSLSNSRGLIPSLYRACAFLSSLVSQGRGEHLAVAGLTLQCLLIIHRKVSSRFVLHSHPSQHPSRSVGCYLRSDGREWLPLVSRWLSIRTSLSPTRESIHARVTYFGWRL